MTRSSVLLHFAAKDMGISVALALYAPCVIPWRGLVGGARRNGAEENFMAIDLGRSRTVVVM